MRTNNFNSQLTPL